MTGTYPGGIASAAQDARAARPGESGQRQGLGLEDIDGLAQLIAQIKQREGERDAARRELQLGEFLVEGWRVPADRIAALQSLRPHVIGRIVAIVGAGGDRDRGKRPLMGEAARQYADVVYVTDDNPRTEDPAAIRAEVMAGAGPDATEVGDRAEAILRGVDALLPGDALLICGKGHETGQIIGNDIYPFDDAEQASVAVAALDGKI